MIGEEGKPQAKFISSGSSLNDIVKFIIKFLKGPLHPCDNCNKHFSTVSQMQQRRLSTIHKYCAFQQHPDLFNPQTGWKLEWFDPRFVEAVIRRGTPEAIKTLCTEVTPGIYSFPMFRADFCQKFVEELDQFEASGLPVRRPNSMNNYGVILNDIGMESMFDLLQKKYLILFSRIFYPEVGASLDRHHSFVVRYRTGEDLGLDMHTDASDVTFNICVGKQFTGANLTFCGMMGASNHRGFKMEYQHVRGTCLVHLGNQRHGAQDITSGERLNIIIWNTSIAYRSTPEYKNRMNNYQQEGAPPDPRCLSYTHDKDYSTYKQYPEGQEGERAWCPPPGLAHKQPPVQYRIPGM